MDAIQLDGQVRTMPCSLAREWDEVRLDRIQELAGEGQVRFTASGAEAVCQILWFVFFEVVRKQGKTHFITSPLEEDATLQMLGRLEDLGCFVKMVRVNGRGEIDLEHLESLIGPRTALISLSVAQGWTGVVQPVEELSKLARARGVLLHLDATHAVGKMGVAWQADYVTFGGDLIHSIPGTGALVTKGVFEPVLPLPSNEAAAMALCGAAHQALLFADQMTLEVARLQRRFEEGIGAEVAYAEALRLPNISVLLFPGVHREALAYCLRRKGVKVEMGPLERLLCASGYSREVAETALSFALNRMTTAEEVERAIEVVNEVVASLQKVSCEL